MLCALCSLKLKDEMNKRVEQEEVMHHYVSAVNNLGISTAVS